MLRYCVGCGEEGKLFLPITRLMARLSKKDRFFQEQEHTDLLSIGVL